MQFTDMQNQCLWGWMHEYTARSNNVENYFTSFVGSEEELGIKEYYLDNKMSKVYILDGSSFFHLLANKNLEKSYEKFILDSEKNLCGSGSLLTEKRYLLKRF